MRKNVATFIAGLTVGVIIGVFAVHPAIYAWTHQLNFFETWFNMFAFIIP